MAEKSRITQEKSSLELEEAGKKPDEHDESLNLIIFQKLENNPPVISRYPVDAISHALSPDVIGYKYALLNLKAGFWEYSKSTNQAWLSDEVFSLLEIPVDCDVINFKNLLKSIQLDDRYSFSEIVPNLGEEDLKMDYEFRLTIDNNGLKQIKTLHCLASPMEDSSGGSKIIGVIYDVTEVRKHEDELIKSKFKAEESDRLKSVFLTNMSHEIRTPMNAILGFTELLNIGGQTPEKKKEFLDIIKNKSKYLLSLIDDIIELAKSENGELNINKTDTNVVKILTELHGEFLKEKIRLNKDHIEIYLNLPPDQKITSLHTDPGRLQQILTYLLDNALKYTEKGYVQLGYELKDSRNLQFFVKDTGIGIPKEIQKFIFNRFKYKEDTPDKKYGTSGLSLTITKAVVELLGGKMHVESAVNQGSTFSFTIPLSRQEKEDLNDIKTIADNPTYNWKNRVILVAEDEEVNFKFIEAILYGTQVQLLHATNGQQAVDLCKSINKIDLVLMDIKMPGMNGYEAVKEIKKIRKDLPIIAQTAYTFKEEKHKCKASGCDDYISKPIDIDELLKMINRFFTD